MLKLKSSHGILASLAAAAALTVASLAIASTDGAEPADQADDVIPQEEMAADPASLDFAGLNATGMWDDVRAILNKEKATFPQKRVQIMVYKTMKSDTGRQHMDILVDGKLEHRFTVSTAFERKVKGKSGRVYFADTPDGQFVPDSFESKRYSNLWKVWLKYVIRFSGGVWIHATTPEHYAELGAPASGGCVRLHEDDAETLFKLVNSYGMNEVGITIIPAAGEAQAKPKKAPGRLIEGTVQ